MNHGNAFSDRNTNRNANRSANKNMPECSFCCGRHMTKDEIAQERRNSGWNPYWAEEESGVAWKNEVVNQPEGLWGSLMGNDPMLESQRLAERDLRQLQFMYPAAAKIMLPYIEETCDRMEYDGSTMYDQYPDRITIYRLAEEIFEKVQDQFPEQCPVKKDELLAMQYHEPAYGYNQPGINWVQDLARVLLLNEMHHRRRRKKNLFN